MTDQPTPQPTHEMDRVLSASAASELDWTLQYDDEHTFPFVEDENENITGLGHQDLHEFAAAVNAYEAVSNGGEPMPVDDQWTDEHVTHAWVTVDVDGERLHPCDEATPDAIAVTTLWGHRG